MYCHSVIGEEFIVVVSNICVETRERISATVIGVNGAGGRFAAHSKSGSNFRGLPLPRAVPANRYSTRHSMSLA